MTLTDILSLFGPLGVIVALVVLGLLSRRLGRVTHMFPYYIGFYIAAGLMTASLLVRVFLIQPGTASIVQEHPAILFAYVGLPALSMTLGVVIAWRYWSWLLAERA
jgi:hypothetical protein